MMNEPEKDNQVTDLAPWLRNLSEKLKLKDRDCHTIQNLNISEVILLSQSDEFMMVVGITKTARDAILEEVERRKKNADKARDKIIWDWLRGVIPAGPSTMFYNPAGSVNRPPPMPPSAATLRYTNNS